MSEVKDNQIDDIKYGRDSFSRKSILLSAGENSYTLDVDNVNRWGNFILEHGVKKANSKIIKVRATKGSYDGYLTWHAIKICNEICDIFDDIMNNSCKFSLWIGWAYLKFVIKLIGKLNELLKLPSPEEALKDGKMSPEEFFAWQNISSFEKKKIDIVNNDGDTTDKLQLSYDSKDGLTANITSGTTTSTKVTTISSVEDNADLVCLKTKDDQEWLVRIDDLLKINQDVDEPAFEIEGTPINDFLAKNDASIPEEESIEIPASSIYLGDDKVDGKGKFSILTDGTFEISFGDREYSAQDIGITENSETDPNLVTIVGRYALPTSESDDEISYQKFSCTVNRLKLLQWQRGNMGVDDEPDLYVYVKRNDGKINVKFDAICEEKGGSKVDDDDRVQLEIDDQEGYYTIHAHLRNSLQTFGTIKLLPVDDQPELVRVECKASTVQVYSISSASFLVEKEKLLGRIQGEPIEDFIEQNNIVIPEGETSRIPISSIYLDGEPMESYDSEIIEIDSECNVIFSLEFREYPAQDVRVESISEEDSDSVQITGNYQNDEGNQHHFKCTAEKEDLFEWQHGNARVETKSILFSTFFKRNDGVFGTEFEAICIQKDHKKPNKPVKLRICQGNTRPHFQVQWRGIDKSHNGDKWVDIGEREGLDETVLVPFDENDSEQKGIKIWISIKNTGTYEFKVKKDVLLNAIHGKSS